MSKFEIGDRVRVFTIDYGSEMCGVVETVNPESIFPYNVRLENGYLDSFQEDDLVLSARERKAPHGPQEYLGNGRHEWEPVALDTTLEFATYRLRVPGGWLYGTQSKWDGLESNGVNNLTLVPVPDVVGYPI